MIFKKSRQIGFEPRTEADFCVDILDLRLLLSSQTNFSVALPTISEELAYSKLTLGAISGAFSISYALGQFVHGQLADRLGAKKVILLGLALSGLMNALFGYVDSLPLLILIWAVNGSAQSTGWPSAVKIISNWFRSAHGTVGGVFGTCFPVGNLITWPIMGHIVTSYGWRAGFFAPSMLLLSMAALFYFGAKDRPEENGRKTGRFADGFRPKRIFITKKLITISLAYVLLQFVRSGFSFWAPSYFFERYSLSLEAASYVAAVVPLGGMVGSMISGWLSDRAKRFGRSFVMFMFIVSLSLSLFAFNCLAAHSLEAGVILLFLVGLTLYGPHVLITTVIPLEQEESHGVAGVAGFIDGMGYIGSTFADPFIGWIADVQGRNGVVLFWLISSLAAATLILAVWSSERPGALVTQHRGI